MRRATITPDAAVSVATTRMAACSSMASVMTPTMIPPTA